MLRAITRWRERRSGPPAGSSPAGAPNRGSNRADHAPEYRYGAVLALTAVLVLFVIVAPAAACRPRASAPGADATTSDSRC